jgi:hypothetical protein
MDRLSLASKLGVVCVEVDDIEENEGNAEQEAAF